MTKLFQILFELIRFKYSCKIEYLKIKAELEIYVYAQKQKLFNKK